MALVEIEDGEGGVDLIAADQPARPAWLDRWVPWLAATIGLILLSYGPQLISQIANMSLTSPGFKVW